MLRAPVAAILLLLLAACGSTGGGNELTACESAVQEAAQIDPMQDTVADLDRAIQQCESLADFEAAASQFPDALDGVSAEVFLGNRCRFEPSVANAPLCVELGAQ
jgi:hypothetical protein